MKPAYAVLFLLIAPSLFAQTTITTNPATPAPNETFTFTVRGSWPNGCVPRFQSVTGSGTTIQINAVQTDCNAVCPQLVTPYSFETTPGTIRTPGIYTIEYHIIDCSQKDTIVTTQTIAISGRHPFCGTTSMRITLLRTTMSPVQPAIVSLHS